MLQRYFRAVVVGGVVFRVVPDVSFAVVTIVLLELVIVKDVTVVSLFNSGEDVVVRLLIGVVLSLSVTMVSDGVPDTNPSSAISVEGGEEVTLKVEPVGNSETLIELVTKTVGSTLLGKRVSVGSEVIIHWLSLTEDMPSGSLVTGGGLVTSKEVLYAIKGVVAQSVVEFISSNEFEGSIEGVSVNDGSKYGTVVSGKTSEGSRIVVLKGSNPEISVDDSSVQELLPAGCRSSSNKAVSM